MSKLHPKLIDLSLTRITKLLELLGNPQDSLPPTVHVAGTNGKGSTIAFLNAVLKNAGYKVHVYSSPHLVNFNERIRLSGELVNEKRLIELLNFVETINSGEPITFFEITTAAAFVAFATDEADILLLETGLGGRLDTTNVVNSPKLSILTPISYDHQKFLGNNLSEIAREKAGIIKHGVPCVVAQQKFEAMLPIAARAEDLGGPLYVQNEDWFIETKKNHYTYKGAISEWNFPQPNLIGAHQIENAGLALAALDRLVNFQISNKNIEIGINSVSWPGRLQQLKFGPLVSTLPKNWELWLDGGHNPAAAIVLREFISQKWNNKPLHLILGMMESKDSRCFLNSLKDLALSICTLKIPLQKNALSSIKLSKMAAELDIKTEMAASTQDAVNKITNSNSSPARILICGSLYLAGYILQTNG